MSQTKIQRLPMKCLGALGASVLLICSCIRYDNEQLTLDATSSKCIPRHYSIRFGHDLDL